MRKVYMDNNATTKTRKEVVDAILPYFSDIYGNASSIHQFGRAARVAVDKARADVAALTGAGVEASTAFDFCLRAAKAGYQLFVDTGVLCGHLQDPQPATVEDYLKLRDSGALARHIIRPADSAA